MIYSIAADLVLVLHLVFVVFVVLGALLAFRWPWIAWIHVPAAAWGALAEFYGAVCPLTPLEQLLRQMSGEVSYTEGFIEHYLMPVLYPAGLTPSIQYVLGTFVVVVNAGLYGCLLLRRRRAKASRRWSQGRSRNEGVQS